MDCSVTYYNDANYRILIRTFKGTVNVDDIVRSWEYLITNNLIHSECMGIISDLRGVDFHITLNEIVKLKKLYDRRADLLKNLKIAQIIDTPKIAYPILFETKYKNVKSKAFSTMGAARDWIIQ